MALFKTCVRHQRADLTYVVYIRVTHNRKVAYIKTDKVITSKSIRNGEIIDPIVLSDCAISIRKYLDLLNTFKTDVLTVHEVIGIISHKKEEISFTEYTKQYINKMICEGRERPSTNYRSAIRSLSAFTNKENLLFVELTSKILNEWIYSLRNTLSAKNQYPKCIKTMFEAGCLEYNDYDRDIIKIKNQPFRNVRIPSCVIPEKRSIGVNSLIKFFECNSEQLLERDRFAQDVCLLSFCLVGMNTADLFDVEKQCLKDNWLLCYNRKKTRDKRGNGAYIEIYVPEFIRPLFEKYKGNNKLFCFSERYSTPENFYKYVDISCHHITKIIGIDKVTVYSFRHSWATIAQNKCNATTDDVAFSLNHASGHKITEGYIQTDYTRIDKLNKKVLTFVFGEINF